MRSADTDNSGTINYTGKSNYSLITSEFIAATLEASIYNREENLRNAFNKFDMDGSGKISIEELKQMLGGEGY